MHTHMPHQSKYMQMENVLYSNVYFYTYLSLKSGKCSQS